MGPGEIVGAAEVIRFGVEAGRADGAEPEAKQGAAGAGDQEAPGRGW